MPLTEIQHKVSFQELGRIDRVVQNLTKLSRADVRGLFDHGCVTLDGYPCVNSGQLVHENSLVSLKYDPHRRYKERPQYQSPHFRILHEDTYLLVVEKAGGILTVPTIKREKVNLVAALNIYLRKGRTANAGVAVVHRLDRDTSGLLVFGKSEDIAQKIKSQFEAHKPTREYLAIVAGTLGKAQGTFRSYLSTDEDLNQHSTADTLDGKLAITHYEVVEVFQNTTLVKVHLETGRRNQIRVHFSEVGNPVLGDTRYKPALARHPAWRYPRLALHAAKLGFNHPITGKSLLFEAAPGIEFEHFLRSQRSKTL
jgi:23S rRNA pseudouridine1911/1915/1917 synthase